MGEILAIRQGLGFDGPLGEMLQKLQNETTLADPENDAPLVVVLVSNGDVDADGYRIVDVMAGYDMDPVDAVRQIASII